MITHGACGKSWSGATYAHCGGCCETFSGTSAFDDHQKWPKGVEPTGVCREPGAAGLVAVSKPWGVLWSRPSSGVLWWKSRQADEPAA